MKITINSRVLKSALESANKAINPKPTIPILANFLLEGDGQYLTITGSDEGTTIKETIPCETEGKVILPTSVLELVRKLPEGDVTIEAEQTSAKVLWSNGRSSFPAFLVDEYPVIPQFNGEYITIKGETLARALAFTLPHTGSDALRPVMEGVCFNAKDGVIDFVASDSYTLGLYKAATEHNGAFDFVINRNAAKLVADKAKADDASFATDGKNVFFVIGATQIVARRIEGKFPNYASIMPKNFTSTLNAGKELLVDSVRRVMACASKASGHIRLNLGMLENTIDAEDMSIGVSAKESVEGISFDGADLSIGFKGELLVKSVAAIEGDDVKISFNGPSKAAIVTGANESELSFVMPVHI